MREEVCDVGGVDNGVYRHGNTVSVSKAKVQRQLTIALLPQNEDGLVWRWGQGEGGVP
jgi:hypothetical protein